MFYNNSDIEEKAKELAKKFPNVEKSSILQMLINECEFEYSGNNIINKDFTIKTVFRRINLWTIEMLSVDSIEPDDLCNYRPSYLFFTHLK